MVFILLTAYTPIALFLNKLFTWLYYSEYLYKLDIWALYLFDLFILQSLSSPLCASCFYLWALTYLCERLIQTWLTIEYWQGLLPPVHTRQNKPSRCSTRPWEIDFMAHKSVGITKSARHISLRTWLQQPVCQSQRLKSRMYIGPAPVNSLVTAMGCLPKGRVHPFYQMLLSLFGAISINRISSDSIHQRQ